MLVRVFVFSGRLFLALHTPLALGPVALLCSATGAGFPCQPRYGLGARGALFVFNPFGVRSWNKSFIPIF